MENDISRSALIHFIRDMILQKKGAFNHEDVISLHVLRKVIERMNKQEFSELRAEAVLEIIAGGMGIEYIPAEAIISAAKWAVETIKDLKGKRMNHSPLGEAYAEETSRFSSAQMD